MILDRFLPSWFFSASGRVSTWYCLDLFSRHACQSDKTDLFSSLQACALIHDKQTNKEKDKTKTKLFTGVLKLKNLPLNPYIINWWLSFLRDRKQRFVHRNVTCNWKTVNKGTTQCNVSGPYLFIIFLNDLDVKIGAEPAIIKCADDCTVAAPVMKGHDFSPDLIRQFVGWTETNSMNCNFSKCKDLVFRKKGHTDVQSTISGIPQCTELNIFQPNCRFDIHVTSKLVKTNKCLYVIRTLRKEGCTQGTCTTKYHLPPRCIWSR